MSRDDELVTITCVMTRDEANEILTALGIRRAIVETGTTSFTWDDAVKMGKDSREQFDIREPTSDQIMFGQKIVKLYQKIAMSITPHARKLL